MFLGFEIDPHYWHLWCSIVLGCLTCLTGLGGIVGTVVCFGSYSDSREGSIWKLVAGFLIPILAVLACVTMGVFADYHHSLL